MEITITRDDIARLRSLHEQATPGPWETMHRNITDACYSVHVIKIGDVGVDVDTYCGFADTSLISAMRNALPALLDAAEAALRRIADLEAERDAALAQVAELREALVEFGTDHGEVEERWRCRFCYASSIASREAVAHSAECPLATHAPRAEIVSNALALAEAVDVWQSALSHRLSRSRRETNAAEDSIAAIRADLDADTRSYDAMRVVLDAYRAVRDDAREGGQKEGE